MDRSRRRWLLLALAGGAAGCAGFRGGWQSVPYLDEPPPADAEARAFMPPFRLPGLELGVELGNRVRTYDNAFILVPVAIDPRSVTLGDQVPGRTRVYLRVTPAEPGWLFRPSQAVLGVGAQRFGGVAGHRFAQWNPAGEAVERGGTWAHRPVAEGFALADEGARLNLSVDFALPVPSAERADLSLDLALALASPRHPPLPLVRFAPRRWKEGYT